jgi:streptogramin lyase
MSDDFTARLRMQLRDAGIRDERRGALSRTLVAARPRPAVALAALAAVAAAVALVVGTVLLGSAPPEPATPPGPRVVADVALGDGFGATARPAFGAMWLSDSSRGEVLRVDLRTRRVTRRIPVGSEAALATGAGSVWTLPRGPGYQGGPLLRIGPATGRTIARIPLRTAAGGPFPGGSLLIGGGRVWVLGPSGAMAVDPARDRVVAEIRLGGSFTVSDAIVHDGELWISRRDGSVTRFDARTGRIVGTLTMPEFGPQGMVAVGRGVWLITAGGRAVIVEP